jgi:hypothetical protein
VELRAAIERLDKMYGATYTTLKRSLINRETAKFIHPILG